MPRSKDAQERHNELRRQSREKSRQAMFCMDYIQTVYPAICNEATGFFTLLNSRYPGKVDLKKTNEYTSFKKICNGEESASGEQFYFDIKTGLVMVKQTESPQAPESSPFETIETIQTSYCPAPQSPEAPETSCCQAPEPSRFETIQTSCCQAPESPQTIEPSHQTTSKELEPQLQITLMSEQQVNKAMVSTETLDITTEQEMPPVSIDEIPHEIIDEIIAQLREDPDLSDVFQDLDFQMEFDSLGEDLDLPETTAFEQEPWW